MEVLVDDKRCLFNNLIIELCFNIDILIQIQELLKSTTKICRTAIAHLSKVATSGSWIEYHSSLKKTLALGLEEEVDSIQKQWAIAKTNVIHWFQQVKCSWEIKKHVVSEMVKEAYRLGLVTLAQSIEATMIENENKVLIGLVQFFFII